MQLFHGAGYLPSLMAGIHYFDQESDLRRYITHILVLFFLQTLLMDVPWHGSIEFLLILIITTALYSEAMTNLFAIPS